MADVQTSAAGSAAVQTPPQKPRRSNEQKKRTRALIRKIITTVIVLAVLAAAVYGVWYFVFREDKGAGELGEPIFDYAEYGSIVSQVTGGGSANAKDSASIVLTQDGVVQELYVSQGQMVYEGQPLYVISSEKAEKALTDAEAALVKAQENYEAGQARLAALEEELGRLQATRSQLMVTAPHPGKLMNVAGITVGEQHGQGSPIASIVDDTRLKLSLYYSYAYEDDIHVGDEAVVSVPALMVSLPGKVEKINKVKMITPEGGVNFEVVFVVNNPGTMTEGMTATASMTDAAGSPMFPYADGAFTYYQTTAVTFLTDGPVERLVDLINSAEVTEGQVLVVQSPVTLEERVREQQRAIDDYRETTLTALQEEVGNRERAVEDARLGLDNFSAVAPITGMITGLALYEGAEVTAGSTAVMIADNSVMTVTIQVDDRNRQYIDVGMELILNDWYGNTYTGVVDSLAVIGENMNGVTVYPGVVRVENPMGTLMGGYYLNYSFTAAQSEGVIVIPKGDVRYYSPSGANEPQAVVYVQTDEERENVINKAELPAEMQQEIPKGCIPVAVETGLTDTFNVEIVSGLREGDMVYNNTPKENYWG